MITDDDIIRAYVDEGLSLQATGKRFSIGNIKVRKILTDNGIPLKKQGGDRTGRAIPYRGVPKPNLNRRVSVEFIADVVKWWFDVRDLHDNTDTASIARHVAIAFSWKFLPDCTEWQLEQLFVPEYIKRRKKYVRQSAGHVVRWANSPFRRHGLEQLGKVIQLAAQREGTRWTPRTDPIH